MYPSRYYPSRYFPPRYWPPVGASAAPPAFRAAGALAHDIVGVTPGAPAGLTIADVEFLFCESADEPISLATANGFAEVTGSPISVPDATLTIATRGACFWRRWNGTDGDPVTNDPGNHILAQRFAISGCIATGDPWDFIQTSSEAIEDTDGSADGNTTAGANRLIVIAIGAAKPDTVSTTEISNIVNAALANLTKQADNAGNAGNGGHIGLATGEKASAGAIGATTYDKATAAYKWHFVIALKSPAAGATAVPVFLHQLKQQGIA